MFLWGLLPLALMPSIILPHHGHIALLDIIAYDGAHIFYPYSHLVDLVADAISVTDSLACIALTHSCYLYGCVCYLCVRHESGGAGRRRSVDWEWLNGLPAVSESEHVRHVRLDGELRIKVDGRSGQGAVWAPLKV